MGTLGSGCFGTVKRCRNKVDGAVYAVKIMGCNDRKNINEVRAMAVLSNKECSNIVRYHHSWIEGRQLYMVMEWCETSLRPLLEEHKKSHRYFSEGELKSILQDTLKALSELHQYQVVHLDVKPENILKTFAGRYKLADLGLCR
jgi:serine/threonine protein kinase